MRLILKAIIKIIVTITIVCGIIYWHYRVIKLVIERFPEIEEEKLFCTVNPNKLG